LVVKPSILIYGPSLWTGTTPTEKTIAEAAGYTVTVKDAAAWSATTTAGFSSFNAIVFPDPHCEAPQETPPLSAADGNKATWSPAVTGPMVIIGTDPVYHADPALPPFTAAPSTLMRNAINFAASGTGTGMYMSLSCFYEFGDGVQTVTPLSEFGTFTVSGAEGSTVEVLAPAHPVMSGLDNGSMSGWTSSMHEWFNSYPDGWTPIAKETSTETLRIYIIARP
jgi:hypothetical protein